MAIAWVRFTLVMLVCLLSSFGARAQDEVDNSFGGWHFVEINYKFGNTPWSAMLYFEHENYQYQRLDCWYLRPSIRCTPLPWIKLGLSYDYMKLPNTYAHRVVAEVTGTLREGHLSAALRFRYLHTWKPELGTEDNELRTRLLVSYSIPQAKVTPYLATESYTWGFSWSRTRNYLGCIYDVTSFMQIEAFYMLTFNQKSPEHTLGLGLNFNL